MGGLPHCMLRYTPTPGPEAGTPPGPEAAPHPPPLDHRQALPSPRTTGRHPLPPPQRSACWEIRATSGRYASYWNAILFNFRFCRNVSWWTSTYWVLVRWLQYGTTPRKEVQMRFMCRLRSVWIMWEVGNSPSAQCVSSHQKTKGKSFDLHFCNPPSTN